MGHPVLCGMKSLWLNLNPVLCVSMYVLRLSNRDERVKSHCMCYSSVCLLFSYEKFLILIENCNKKKKQRWLIDLDY
ncbi:hypothetical protein HanPI659440_Chr11g0411071 [Helianthus annuus]|nr:hypothetical protein HanPI659440_Chr11g0411071 [Helianthus annuus]